LRELERLAIAARDYEHALAVLRDAVVSRIDHLPHRLVARACLAVDLLDAGENAVKPFALALVGKPVDVLEQESFRLRVTKNSQVSRQCVGAGIIEPHSIATRPVPRLGE